MTCGRVGSGLVPELWGKPLWEKVWPFLEAWDSVRLRTASTQWNVSGKYGPFGEPFFFLIKKKEPMILSESIGFGPALFGMHMMAEEKAFRSEVRCTSSGCMGPVTRSLSPCRTGRWQRWHEAVTWPWTCCARKCTNWKGDVAGSGFERACQ